jgi:DNA-binding NarL/FixJ family response regulator
MPIQILLADDHALVREMLREVLSHRGDAYAVVGEAAEGPQALDLVACCHPDLLLLDYKMPGLGRLSAFCKGVACRSPATRILILSGYAEEEVALEAAIGRAKGYILKDAPIADLLRAIDSVHAGGVWVDPHLPPKVFHTFLHRSGGRAKNLEKLTRQELRILSLVAQEMGTREISAHLHIGQKTVRNHLAHVFAKLGVVNRQQAALYFLADKKG